jgi:glycosyltransferase involved in cell wall biosynthesis
MTEKRRICVVGPGTRFLSGITYYTYCLINALSDAGHDCSAVFIRKLVPARLYPGRARIGANLTALRLSENVRRVDGVNWYWGWSIIQASVFLLRERPRVLVLQWWTGAVLHTYLLLAALARLLGAKVIVEFHEAQDVGEARVPFAVNYMNIGGHCLLKMSVGQLVHSEFDRNLIRDRYGLDGTVRLVPHATYDYLPEGLPMRTAPPGVINLLYFGVIRPFKGVEDLIAAFDMIEAKGASRFWLTVVGETWEGWELPERLIAASSHKDRITFVNRYVTDAEAAGFFSGADLVVLPYHRSSSSGPLQIAMARGLPIVVTKVGGLAEATSLYPGTVLVDAGDPASLAGGIERGADLVGQRFSGARSWNETTRVYSELLDRVCGDGPQRSSYADAEAETW